MRKALVDNLKVRDLRHVLLPLKRGRMLKSYVDIGFDTEFSGEDNSADRELISLQFSLGRGKSQIYFVNKREGVTSETLLDFTLKFLNEQDVQPARHIFLISHFAIAELSKVSDFYNEYVSESGFKARPRVSEFNKAVCWEKRFSDLTLHVIDLFGHMKASLEKIGTSLGFEKVKLEVDGKDRAYWICNMRELQVKHSDLFEAYAIRDAEITIEAWRKLVDEYAHLNLDPHLYRTYTSLAVAAFRRSMKSLPCKTCEEKILIKQQRREGWREHIAKKLVYAGDLRVRLLACLSYWGGNNQAFVRGYMKHMQGAYYDFVSLYIIAGILQPLSNEFTQYRELNVNDVKEGAEGFAEVDFSFPESEPYPCLPVQESYYPKLMFPLSGVSYCTLSELRQASLQGVKINNFRGFGFYPDVNEIEHDLKPFLSSMLEKKASYDLTPEGRKSIDREIEKAKMVGIVGRLAYMRPSRTAEDITRLLHESSLKLVEFREYGRKRAIHDLTARSEVGGSWCIEWASLILGRARSMAAWAIHQGEKCLSISTDGGFWLGDPKFENSDLHKALVPYHSGIRFEGSFDELFVARNRVYVAWNRGQVLHCAMMGIAARGSSSDEKKLNFQNMIRQKLTEGRDHRLYDSEGKEVREEVTVKRLTGLNDFLYKGIGLNSAEFKPKKISWNPDFKRKLLNADVNIFKDWTETAPYNTVEDAFRDAFNVKPVGRPKVVKPLGRPEALPKAFKAKLLTPEFQVLTHRQAAAKLGVSVSTVKRERERLRGER